MPEGDTVWRAAQTLRRALVGEMLVHADLRGPAHAPPLVTDSRGGSERVKSPFRAREQTTRPPTKQG